MDTGGLQMQLWAAGNISANGAIRKCKGGVLSRLGVGTYSLVHDRVIPGVGSDSGSYLLLVSPRDAPANSRATEVRSNDSQFFVTTFVGAVATDMAIDVALFYLGDLK